DFTSRTAVPGPEGPKGLRELLTRVRADGIAEETGEVTEELASVAAAVHDHSGWPVAAVAITFEQSRTSPEVRDRSTSAVRAAAEEITRRLGGRRPGNPVTGG
ncbi:MAG: IclR family transcriptional regulator, partial [Brachybacterium sp.]|nr:IclR family transcriptional regulator [Brachybacterium sp.]